MLTSPERSHAPEPVEGLRGVVEGLFAPQSPFDYGSSFHFEPPLRD
ncbi:MAG: hypothetical protein L6461_16440 [Anaerolineae bacterium]|nr:hypothetical protein [Anaerolineae bacterium]